MFFPQTIIATSPHVDEKIYPASTANNNQWIIWRKPVGKTMAYILTIGAGAGGGQGRSNGTPAGGGGGGGSAGITSLLIPLLFLPDNLYISVNYGAAAAATGTASVIANAPSNTVAGVFLKSSNSTATAGGVGTAGSGAGGAGATVFISSNGILSALGIWSAIAGATGANGDGSTTALASLPLTGGAGGGSDFAGTPGSINGAGVMPTINPVNAGVVLYKPFVAAGGSGSNTSGVSGAKGSLGCGGGGGRGAQSDATSGGKGGDGLVGIWCW